MKRLIMGLVVLLFSMGLTIALPLPIVNSSFESQILANGGYIVNNVTGWTVEEPVANTVWVYNPNTETPGGIASDGENALLIWKYQGVKQTLSSAAKDDSHYKFSVDVYSGGGPGVYAGNDISIVIGSSGNSALIQSYDQSSSTNDNMVAIRVLGSLSGEITNFVNTSSNGYNDTNFASTYTNAVWQTLALEFDILAESTLNGEDIEIIIRKFNDGTANWTLLDNIQMDIKSISVLGTLMIVL